MKKGAALCFVVPLLAIVSSVEVMAGATISDRRYWPNEARGSPSQAIEISPPYTISGALAGTSSATHPTAAEGWKKSIGTGLTV